MTARLRQLFVLTLKELRQLVRDRTLFGFVIYIFTLHVVISSLGASDDVRRAPTAVHDGDRTPESRELVYRMRPPYFHVNVHAASSVAGAGALDAGTARVLLDVPADFAQTLGRGDRQASAQLVIDTSKVSLGYLAASYTVRIAEAYGAELGAARLARFGVVPGPPRIENRERTWFNFTLDVRRAMSLQTLLTMMTVACVVLPASAAVREKERGTIEQLLVSPLTPLQMMTSKVGAMVLVTLAGSAVSFYAILGPIFDVAIRGSAPLLFAMIALYASALAGLGLVLATLARSSGQVGLLVILTVLPMLILSGLTSPVESMPGAMRWAIELSPLYHFAHIVYGIVFRGEGLATLWPSALAVAALGAGLFALGRWRFTTQFG